MSILGFRLFFSITFNISCHSLLACSVSAEKSTDSLMRILFYVMCCFSLVVVVVVFKYFLFNFCHLINVCLSVFFLTFILPGTLCFLDLSDCFPCGGIFQLLSFQIFSQALSVSSSWDPYNVGAFNVVPEVSQTVIYFHSFFFILFQGSDFHHSVFQLT